MILIKWPGMLTAIGLDFTVNPKGDVNQEAMFVMVTIFVEIIQMKIHKSVTVVSEIQSFLCKMISLTIT